MSILNFAFYEEEVVASRGEAAQSGARCCQDEEGWLSTGSTSWCGGHTGVPSVVAIRWHCRVAGAGVFQAKVQSHTAQK